MKASVSVSVLGAVMLLAGCAGTGEDRPPGPATDPPATTAPIPPPTPPPAPATPPPLPGSSPSPTVGDPIPPPAPAPTTIGGDPGRFGPGFSNCRSVRFVQSEIIQPHCALCHDRRARFTFVEIDLVARGWWDRLRGRSYECPDRPLARTRPTLGGLFFDKLNGGVAGCGDRMPPFGSALTADEIACLKAFVIATE